MWNVRIWDLWALSDTRGAIAGLYVASAAGTLWECVTPAESKDGARRGLTLDAPARRGRLRALAIPMCLPV